MGLFNRKKKVTPSKFGELLGKELKDGLSDIFKEQNLLKIKEKFTDSAWDFNFARFSFELMNIFEKMVSLKLIREYPRESDWNNMLTHFQDSLPKEFFKHNREEDLKKLFKSDQPLLTISRIAAENYFDKEIEIEEVFYFLSFAKAFNYFINKIFNKVELI